ncbi:c-type cytochrome [candidate division KSB1 bacterium]|nr:c-type cytochrome [candidate division KSB1 bacterium]
MDFPLFHLDFIGNRMLIALTAIIHVIVNHPMAVGAVPLAALLEWIARRRNNPQLDKLAYNFTFVIFIITTSLGALTGVGIWFTTALVNPDAIGSLLRVFFWAWFSEWIVFVIEVCMIMVYFLTWKSMSLKHKSRHIAIGVFLSFFSWLTMAIITGILGFMMNTGNWVPYIREWSANSGLFTAFFNPLYLPQLVFRTPFALMTAGLFFMFLTFFFTKKEDDLRHKTVRYLSAWTLVWLPLTALAGYWYWKSIPSFMASNAPIAMTTQDYTSWYPTILVILQVLVIFVILISLLGIIRSRWLPRVVLLVPFIVSIALLGSYERVREFVRKPFVIKDYLYANGLRVDHYPLYKEGGILPYASFVSTSQVTESNQLQAGQDIFMLTCSRCHTVGGLNSVNKKFKKLFPNGVWKKEQLSSFITNMHNIRPFMPPFPGNDRELDALTAFIIENQDRNIRVEGAQTAGFTKNE